MINYYETHLNAAQSLYRQRLNWMQMERVDMQSMLHLEYRLRVHLHVLAHELEIDEAEPEAAPDPFVYLACRLSSRDPTQQTQAAELACQWLGEDSARAQGARDALLLFPHLLVNEAMSKAYRDNEALRAIFIYILAQHGARLPQGLINQAELQQRDPQLQAQILYYAANQASAGLDQFSHYYQPLLLRTDNLPEHAVIVAALWGGLVRGDDAAVIALRRAIEREPNDMQRLDLLRLAALTGDAEYFPIFESLTQHVPQLAYHFLGLYGRPDGVEMILQGLSHPRTALHAELAWWWVSGQTLPKKPRLSVVGEESLDEDLEDNVGFVPDALPAQQWWIKQKKDSALRYLQGQPLNRARIQATLKQYAGMISHDLIDLLAMQNQQALLIGTHTWHDARVRKLQALTDTDPKQTAVLATEAQRA
jgi:hypothetical protein